jgi:hypothetical protein
VERPWYFDRAKVAQSLVLLWSKRIGMALHYGIRTAACLNTASANPHSVKEKKSLGRIYDLITYQHKVGIAQPV